MVIVDDRGLFYAACVLDAEKQFFELPMNMHFVVILLLRWTVTLVTIPV